MPGVAESAAFEPGGVQLLDPAGDQVLADRGAVGLGEDVLHLAVRRRDDPVDDLGRVVVPELDALEVEDRQAAQPRQLAGQAHVRDGVHGRGEDRDPELDAAERLAERRRRPDRRCRCPGASETSSNP